MEIILLGIGTTSAGWVAEGMADYTARLRRYATFRFEALPDIRKSKSMPEGEQKTREGRAILAFLRPSDYVVLLDERGRQRTSVDFASWLEKKMASGRKRLVFVTGGPYGFSQEVYDRADEMVSLSLLTFSHEMVRLFFIEQVYRAFTILRGEPYHHS